MLDWTAFHAACLAREQPAILADACATAWQWLDLEPAQRDIVVDQAIASPAAARTLSQALALVKGRLLREAAGAPGESAHGADTARRAEAVLAMQQLVAASVAATASSENEDRERLNVVTAALSAALEQASGPFVDTTTLDALARATEALKEAGSSMGPVVAREHAWWMGLALWGLGTAAQSLARFEDAHDAFERSATCYDAAGESDSAGQCRSAALALAHRLRGDVDAASTPDMRALLSDQPPLERVATLTRLSREASRAGDRHEAGRLGEQASELLCDLGFRDPEAGFEAACQSWIDTAAIGCHGVDPFKHLSEVVGYWAVVLGARINERLQRDAEASLAAERMMRAVTTEFIPEMVRQAELARHAATERLAAWDPTAASLLPATREVDAGDTAAIQAMNDELYALRVACNEHPQPSLLDEADRLLTRAEAMGSRIHAASALLERAYILNALERPAEVPAVADAAIDRLLEGRPARLGAFATSYERELYLMGISYKARAAAAQRDHHGILATCVPVMHDIESERRRVNSPYQQSATLATRTEIYEMVAAAAWRTGDLDLLLDTTERLKARAALASRLPLAREGRGRAPSGPDDASEKPVGESEALREWKAVNEALRASVAGTHETAALRERRRWLATIVAIERAAWAGVPESLTVAAVQDALAPDEAAISWFWLGTHALFVQAFTRDAHEVAVIALEEAHQAQLQEYLAAIPTLGDSRTKYERLESLIGSLGEVLLPASLRAVVADRPRLVLSPHRNLHLFPFHAIPWKAGELSGRLIQQAAVRYVPNLTSLLLPWAGTTQGRVLSVGVGDFENKGLSPLPGAATEAAAIAEIHGASGDPLLAADRETFIARVSSESYRCLHLATHGSSVLIDDAADDPLESHLSLRDGDLSAWDLAALDLRAELVSLAACHSGQRAVAGRGLAALPGDDLFGLQAVMFEAGVWGVIGALWPVHDETASEIMADVHRAYARRASPDVALHEAIRTHLSTPGRRRNVYYWGPLVLTTMGRHPGAPSVSSRPRASSRPG